MYGRLNHINICTSYSHTLTVIDEISKLHSAPLDRWIQKGVVFKFLGDNVDTMQKVRDSRSDHQGGMLHMYSILVGRSHTQTLPTCDDVKNMKEHLVVLVSRVLTEYFPQLTPFAKVVDHHILHAYSKEMSEKSEVFVFDTLMKNEATHKDMIDIMIQLQQYLGEDYNEERRIVSGGDHLTCEWQVGAQRHRMCGNTKRDRLELLEPVAEDWHALVSLIGVSLEVLWNSML